MVLTPAAVDLLGPYLARQRWYPGAGEPDSGSLRLLESDCLVVSPGGRRLLWAIVEVDGVRFQLLLGEQLTPAAAAGAAPSPATSPDPAPSPATSPDPAPSPATDADPAPKAATGDRAIPEAALLGAVEDRCLYDAVVDTELMLLFFESLAGSPATTVRLVGVEQSNTSLIYDERVILKLYRRLAEGLNPDIEVTSALASAGFDHVAEPVATWRAGGVDLAFAQRFLAGGSDGWALAVQSAREMIESSAEDPTGSPGDFAAESEELGRVTAGLHLALAGAFGVDEDGSTAEWCAFVDDLARRTTAEVSPDSGASEPGGSPGDVAMERVFDRLRAVRQPGPAIRLHGDYHLGQVMQADERWYVLDFEGEPTRSLEERTRRWSVAKDVSGMLRSIDYAARYALREAEGEGTRNFAEREVERAAGWERRNRAAFLHGYLGTPGVEALMAGEGDSETVLAAFELDKALYELRYEEAYRPDWITIPRAAIGRIVRQLSVPGNGG